MSHRGVSNRRLIIHICLQPVAADCFDQCDRGTPYHPPEKSHTSCVSSALYGVMIVCLAILVALYNDGPRLYSLCSPTAQSATQILSPKRLGTSARWGVGG